MLIGVEALGRGEGVVTVVVLAMDARLWTSEFISGAT